MQSDADMLSAEESAASAGAGTAPVEAGVGSLFRGKAWFWAPIAPLVALDLWSKAAAFSFLHGKSGGSPPWAGQPGSATWLKWEQSCRHTVFGEGDHGFFFELVCWRNTGTIWGLARDFNSVLVGLRLVALVLIVYFAMRTARRLRLQLLVLGAILAGALGNLYDNLFEPNGGVRDFLLFRYATGPDEHPLRFLNPFPAFNVADACISVGAITLALVLLFQREPQRPE